MAMRSMPQLVMVMGQKPVWIKHRDARFLPPYAQVSPRRGAARRAPGRSSAPG